MLATAESWNGRFGPFFLQNVFFICIRKPQKKFGWFFLGFTPSKRRFFLEGVAGWPDFQKWGAPLIFGKLHHKEIAFVFGRGTWLTTFPKLRGAPQFRNSAEYEVLLLLYPLWWTDCDRLKARRMAVHWIFEWSTSQAVWCHHPTAETLSDTSLCM